MAKIDLSQEAEQIKMPRWQKILEHIQATINLFNNTPYLIKKDFRHPFFFIIFQSIDNRGNTRELTYNCFSEQEQSRTANILAEHFEVEIEEITD